jgi:hypothetical protein
MRVQEQEPKVDFKPFLIWLISMIIALWCTSIAITFLAPHLEHAQRWPLSISVFLLFWLIPKINLRTPTDVLSRMRAVLTPETKRYSLIFLFVVNLLAVYGLIHALQKRMHSPALQPEKLQSFELLKHRSQDYTLTGHALDDVSYRWSVNDQQEDLYLIPIKEFTGLVLVLSDHKITHFENQWGVLLKIRPWESSRFLDYRAEQHIPLDTPIYLFDIRPYRYFVLPQISLLLVSITLFLLFLGAPIRDSEIESTLVYIPPELRSSLQELDEDLSTNAPSNTAVKENT